MLDGLKRRLLDLREVVFGVAVQLHHADLDQRIIAMRPHLGQIERIVGVLSASASGMIWTHSRQRGKSPLLDRAEEIALRRFAGLADDRRGLRIGPMLVALHGLEVELDPERARPSR